ncbi:MAG TPA: transposase [Verrucomicrobiae bacterium]|nr:transposase [Verrucomicrobiae bacterium]
MSTMCGISTINNWDVELEAKNKDKVGEPSHYPNTFLILLGHAKAYFHLPYRQTEGITQAHAKGKVPSIPIYYNKQKDKSFRYQNKRYNR